MRGVLITVCFGLACAHSPPSPPLTGWRELRSAHFTLRTNLPEDSARSTLEKLETVRWWLQAAWSTGGDSPGNTRVIVLRDPSDLERFTSMGGIAATTREGPILVTAGRIAGQYQYGDASPPVRILAHEVTHDLIRYRMPGAPRWFHEGMAGHLETVRALDATHVRFGFIVQSMAAWRRVDPGRPWGRLNYRFLSLDETESGQWETASGDDLYNLRVSAQLWVRMLRAEEPGRMRALEAELAAGTPWRRAWADLRRTLDVAALKEAVWRAIQSDSLPIDERSVADLPEVAAQPSSERLLADWEVHLSLAELWAIAARERGGEGPEGQVRAELEAAAAAAPDEPVPRIRLADLERDPDLRRARAEALVQRFPGSPDARVFLARVYRDDGGPVEARREAALAAVRAAPDNVDALTAHALEELQAGNPDSALGSVARAEVLESWNPKVFVTRALVLGATGKCDDALAAMQHALDVLPDNPPPGEVRALAARRERISTLCRSGTAL